MKRNMVHKFSFGLTLALAFAFSTGVGAAQTSVKPSTGQVQLAATHPAGQELGAASSSVRLERMLLLLEPSATRQKALTAELKSQQNASSAEFHHWLTPAAFADAYSVSAKDYAAVAAWLSSQGFEVAAAPSGRGWIEFSGTAAQVEQSFQTRVNLLATTHGKRAYLAEEAVLPAALKAHVQGLVSLDGALSSAAVTTPRSVSATAATLAAETSLSKAEALTPALAAQLLHLDTAHAAGQTGAGESIAIAARSNVESADIAAFRTAFGLPASTLSVQVNGVDPGLTADRAEAELAASWAGAAAPGATIVVVPAATTNATDGVDLALAAIVDQALGHTVAVGFSACEASLSAAHQAFYAALYRQAAAEGIAVIAATGDSGAAACHAAGSEARVTSGYAVNALASTPWNTAVGVAALGAEGATALTAWAPASLTDPAYAGGGGSSSLFAAPSWQSATAKRLAAAEASTDAQVASQRLLPDLALPTAIDSAVNRGLAFCFSDAKTATASSDCTLVRAGGSSASAAIFAGIGALLAEKYGAQGNLTPGLYTLSKMSGVYNDVAQGSARLWCAAGSSGCGSEGQIGFAASAGYDLATGLGSVNAQALLTAWSKVEATGTGADLVTITTAAQTVNPSATLTIKALVSSETGGATPTGTVSFTNLSIGSGVALSATNSKLGTNGVASLALNIADLISSGTMELGDNNIDAIYNGDSTYEVNYAALTVDIKVAASSTSLTMTPSTTSPSTGASFNVSATLTAPSQGTVAPTGTISIYVDSSTTASATATVAGAGTYTLPVTIATAGSHTLQAVYSGDSNYSTSSSASSSVTVVTRYLTSLAVTTTPTTPVVGSSTTATATLSTSDWPIGSTGPSGSVTFTLDGVAVGSNALSQKIFNDIATIQLPTLIIGSHTLVASYPGDSSYANSSVSESFTVTQIPTTMALSTTTTPVLGSTPTVLVTVTPSNYTGTSDPTGSVTFTLNGTILNGSVALTPGNPSTTSIVLPVLSTKSYTLVGTYSGDTNFAASAYTLSFTIAPSATNLTLTTTPAAPTVGSSTTVSSTLTAATCGTIPPGGTLTYTLSGTVNETLGTLTISSCTTPASFTLPTLAAGSYTLTGTYTGDNNYAATTATKTFTIALVTTSLTLTTTPATPTAGSAPTVSSTLTTATCGSILPTGTITYTLSGTASSIPDTVTVSSCTTPVSFSLPTLVAGTYTLLASYSGDTNYAATSTTITFTIAAITTNLTVSATTLTPVVGSTPTITSNLTAATCGSTPPTGTITYVLSGTTSGTEDTVTVTSCTTPVSFPLPALTAGAYTLTATYTGDKNYAASTSTLTLTVAQIATNLTLSTPTTTPAVGSTPAITSSLTPATCAATLPTGTITYALSGTTTASWQYTVSSCTTPVSFSLPTLTAGSYSLTATYSGDKNYAASTSTLTLTVAQVATTLTVSTPSLTPAVGSTPTITSSLTAATCGVTLPTGTITYALSGTTTASWQYTVSSCTTPVSFNLPVLTAGSYTLTGSYNGNTNYAASSASLTLTVSKVSSSVVVTPSTTAPALGSTPTVTATVTFASCGSVLPTGTVSFTEDAVSEGTSSITQSCPATASITLPAQTTGSHALIGAYSGDTNYSTSTSASVTVTVPKSPTTVTISPVVITSPTVGGSLTVTATVTPSTYYGTTAPSGTVDILEGGAIVGTGTLSGDPATVSIAVPLTVAGADTLTAAYLGDTNYAASTTTTGTTVTVAKGSTSATVTATGTPTLGSLNTSWVLTATIVPTSTTPVLTGMVSFYDGTALLGSGTVTSSSAGYVATFTALLANNISHSITAIYSGDSNWLVSTSAAYVIPAETLPDTVTLTANVSTATPGLAVILTATVTPTTASTVETNPTGNVIFYDGTKVIGTVALTTSTGNSSTAQLITETLPGGTDSITASYVGDTYYNSGTSNSLILDVENFVLAAASTNPAEGLTIIKGSSGTASFTITAMGGYTGLVQVVCSVPTQDDMTCTASPQDVTPNSTVTFTVQTFAEGSTTTSANRRPQPFWPRAAGGTALAALAFFLLPPFRRARRLLGKSAGRALIFLLLLVGLGGAGLGCNSTTPVVSTGTPLGVAELTITASVNVNSVVTSQSLTLPVNVVTK
jgi:hypothetical protein